MSSSSFRVFIAALGHFTADFYAGWIAPLLFILIEKNMLTLTEMGWLVGVFGITSNLTQPIIGILNDRKPSRYYMVVGPIITALFISSIAWINSIELLFIFIFFGAIGVGMPHPVGASAIVHVPPASRGRAMSIYTSMGHIGYLLGPPVVMGVVKWYGFKSIAYFMPFGICVGIIVQRLKSVDVKPEHHLHIIASFKLILERSRLLLPLWLIAMLRACVATIVTSFVLPLLSFRGDQDAVLYFTLPIFGICGVVGNLFGGPVSDRIGKRKVISISMLFAALSLFGFLSTGGYTSLICLGFMGFFLFSTLPTVIVTAQHIVPESVGTISSLMMGLTFIVGSIFAPIFGKTADLLGTYFGSELIGLFSCFHLLTIPILFAGILAFFLPVDEAG